MEYVPLVRRGLGCLVALTLVFGACNRDTDEPSPPRATSTSTTTTAPADPYAIPDTIDVAYVQRVIDKLYEIEAEAAAEIVANKELVPSAAEKLRSIYAVDELNAQLRAWGDIVSGDELNSFKNPPGPVEVSVVRIGTATATCVRVETLEDATPTAVSPQTPYSNFLRLIRAAPGQNPTPWVIAEESLEAPADFDTCVP